ncbi:hypothetical protein EDC04DRAFT_2710397 [Pisolithus marmoratus]|nr:hypothetical protein EDC04DRAFT_2710397 [Pisolithus marmoratus]
MTPFDGVGPIPGTNIYGLGEVTAIGVFVMTWASAVVQTDCNHDNRLFPAFMFIVLVTFVFTI